MGSELRASGVYDVEISRELMLALDYWPGRWPPHVLRAAMAASVGARVLSPSEWTAVLDRIADAMADVAL